MVLRTFFTLITYFYRAPRTIVLIRFTCGQMTFAEAYKKTGRIFCVTLSSTTEKAPPVLLNYLTTPHVTVASAVVASAAVPGFIPPVTLQYSKYYILIRLTETDLLSNLSWNSYCRG